MAVPSHYLVVYDITDDHERNPMSKILEGYGFRIQKSAFECLLSRHSCEKLQTSLNVRNNYASSHPLVIFQSLFKYAVPPTCEKEEAFFLLHPLDGSLGASTGSPWCFLAVLR